MNEILELEQVKMEEIKRQFETVVNLDSDKVIVRDWLDDSVQIVEVSND